MPTTKQHRRSSPAKQFAAIERISIMGITERIGPLALQLYAENYLSAAKALPEPNVSFEPVRPYLVCHAIELALKAFLSLQGKQMADLAEGRFAHKLGSILSAAEEAGLTKAVPLAEIQVSAIRLAETYYTGKVFEYPAIGEALSGYPSMPKLSVLLEAATLLVANLAKPCRDAK